MSALIPGSTHTFIVTPEPAGAVLASGTSASTTSSDTTNAPITTDPTGLTGTLDIPESAVVNTGFTLTTNYTNPDGTVADSTSNTFTIVAPPPPPFVDVTGFTFALTE